jgi:Flp pilus assembly protein TadG
MKRNSRGSSLVEFAFGFTVLWALLAGVFQFGYSSYQYNVLATAVSNAAELGSQLSYDTADPKGSLITPVTNMVLYGDVAAGATPVAPGLTPGNVDVSVITDAEGMPRAVTVSIRNYTLTGLFQTFNLSNKPRSTAAFLGQVKCASC